MKVETQRPETEQETVQCREIGRTLSSAVNDQELLFHEQAGGDNGFDTAGSQLPGDTGQKMDEEDRQVRHGGAG